MRRRTRARECALKILYAVDVSKNDCDDRIEDYWKNQKVENDEVRSFAEYLVNGVCSNLDKIDGYITKYAANWQIQRMATIDRNIIRMATFELIFSEDIPSRVTINEAVEIAKKFGDKDSSKFVNGILDRINKEEAVNKSEADS